MTASDKQYPSTQSAIEANNPPSKAAQWIEDPFASVIGGIVIPTFAFALLLASMAGLSGILA
jgi:hypothetical protein